MPASPADSALYRDLFSDVETQALFTDSAELRAMLLVEGALARVQGAIGVIPDDAAAYIDRASREVSIDPAALSAATAADGGPIPAFLAAFRKDAGAPEPMQFVHWGVSSQDIMDTALMLRLKRLCGIWAMRLDALLASLDTLAKAHRKTAIATPICDETTTDTSIADVVNEWQRALVLHRQALVNIIFPVSLLGVIGAPSAMGELGPQVCANLATALGLSYSAHTWHSDRTPLTDLSQWIEQTTATLGKMGKDLLLYTDSCVILPAELAAAALPQQQSQVGPSVLIALSRQCRALNALMQEAPPHTRHHHSAAWFTELLSLPQLCVSTGRALSLAVDLVTRIAPKLDKSAQQQPLDLDQVF